MTPRKQVAVTITVGFAVIVIVLLVVLLQTPSTPISSNAVTVERELGLFSGRATVCQKDERLPVSTSALRMSLVSYIGPEVSVTVLHAGRVLAAGRRAGGWVSSFLTLPLHPAARASQYVEICLTRSPGNRAVGLFGNSAPRALAATSNGQPLPGRLRIEYLKPGSESWLARATSVARRVGLGHSPSGTWIVLPLASLMAAAIALGAWLLLREAQNG
jgi:hypothetical protein